MGGASEYLALFGIVLMHEFGHALACRSVGGRAARSCCGPGGVAYVDPPQRPGATLWSIAAGPLVNVGLLPILGGIWLLARAQHWGSTLPNLDQFLTWWRDWLMTGRPGGSTLPDLDEFVTVMCVINLALLIFNLLPIYPLDGGQILRSVLWFMVGRARSLMIASTIGLVSVVLLLVFAIKDLWLGILAVFALIQCWSGLQQARALARLAAAPRHQGLACPSCGTAPVAGNFWVCGHCRRPFDMFETRGVCPGCGIIYNDVRCMECGATHPLASFTGH